MVGRIILGISFLGFLILGLLLAKGHNGLAVKLANGLYFLLLIGVIFLFKGKAS